MTAVHKHFTLASYNEVNLTNRAGRYTVNNAGSGVRGLELSEMYENNTELAIITEVFCCRRHFPISKVFKEKINFRKYLGVVTSSGTQIHVTRTKDNPVNPYTSRALHGRGDKSSSLW